MSTPTGRAQLDWLNGDTDTHRVIAERMIGKGLMDFSVPPFYPDTPYNNITVAGSFALANAFVIQACCGLHNMYAERDRIELNQTLVQQQRRQADLLAALCMKLAAKYGA